ncbi:MAG: hypothetical protein N2484_06795 [Clostridia bacterium]|nr:hypothetical protein [Clostridia bacterium]
MAEDERVDGFAGGNFTALLSKHIGETVTIFTSSGGDSGSGFTGVILTVTPVFVRLITRIGPPPGCSLGNACSNFGIGAGAYGKGGYGKGGYPDGGYGGYPFAGPISPANVVGAMEAGGWNGYPVYTVGSVTDIPLAAIVSFVHNAV